MLLNEYRLRPRHLRRNSSRWQMEEFFFDAACGANLHLPLIVPVWPRPWVEPRDPQKFREMTLDGKKVYPTILLLSSWSNSPICALSISAVWS
jgi:hypothetical protein